jgi:hypothetical protein
MTGNPEEAAVVVDDAAVIDGWWRTATPNELRQAPKVVSAFLAAKTGAQASEVEVFSRALALLQLLEDESAVPNAANAAHDAIPESPQPGASPKVNSEAQAWLPRGRALDAGLKRCLELLRPQEKQEWSALVNRFHLTFHLFELDCIRAVALGGTTAAITVVKPLKLKPRKV